MKLRVPKSKKDFERYYDLRFRILREPWGQERGSEKDDLEEKSIHLMVCDSEKVIGVGRGHFNSDEEAQIRFMAVETDYRGRGVGSMILDGLEKRLRKAKRIVLNARDNAVGFYEKHGYKVERKAHTLFGSIPHFKMKKDL